jgi:cell division protein FtsB
MARRSSRGATRRRTRRRSPVDLVLGVLLLAALGAGAVVLAPPLEGFLAARQRVALLEQQAVALTGENARLERRIDDLDDPLTIELLARRQQGLVRPGEVPYVLVPPEVDAPRIVDAPDPVPAEVTLVDRVLAWLRGIRD